MSKPFAVRSHILLALSLFALAILGQFNPLLFHCLAEGFCIVIAFGMFLFAWNARRYSDNYGFLFLGYAYFFVGCVDTLHLLAYKGMGVFVSDGGNHATQLWLIARMIEGGSLLAVPFLMQRCIRLDKVFVWMAIGTAVLLSSVLVWDIFPVCYVDGQGLTSFKLASEAGICVLLLAAWRVTWLRRGDYDKEVYHLIIASIVLTLTAELLFCGYENVFGLLNQGGHLIKIVSFYVLYRGIIYAGLRRPYALMFHNLRLSELNMKAANARLKEEMEIRRKAEEEKEHLIADLKKALDEIKTLRGILPICAYCKRVRDDEGHWKQVEVYVSERTSANFSHGVCPECMKKQLADLDLLE